MLYCKLTGNSDVYRRVYIGSGTGIVLVDFGPNWAKKHNELLTQQSSESNRGYDVVLAIWC